MQVAISIRSAGAFDSELGDGMQGVPVAPVVRSPGDSGCTAIRSALSFSRTVVFVSAVGLAGAVVFAGTAAFAQMRGADSFESGFGLLSHNAQGYLGVDIRDVTEEQIGPLKLKEARGAEIVRVDHDGPAGKMGLREHDVIVQMNGQTVEGEEQLRKMLKETPAGREVTLVISRSGEMQTLSTRLANRTEVERQAWEQHFTVPHPDEQAASAGGSAAAQPQTTPGAAPPAASGFLAGSVGAATTKSRSFIGSLISGSSYTGAMVETMGPQLAEFFGVQETGVLVHSVDANSPAAVAGLRAGDIVTRANSVKLGSTSDWMKIMHENRGKPVGLTVLRDKKEQTVTLTPDSRHRSSLSSAPLAETDRQGSTEQQAALTTVGFSLR